MVLIIWSGRPSELIDNSDPDAPFHAILWRVRAIFALGMWASLLVALVSFVRWLLIGPLKD